MDYTEREKRDRTPYEASERRKPIRNDTNPATYRSEHTKILYNTRGERSETHSRPKQNLTARIHSPCEYDMSLSQNSKEIYARK